MTHQDLTALPTATDAASLLVQASAQWQTGDWHSLAKLQRDTLQHHPDRAHLALLAAAGRLQMGKDAEAKPFICLSQEWGASKHHIGQMLIAGVHRSLAVLQSLATKSSVRSGILKVLPPLAPAGVSTSKLLLLRHRTFQKKIRVLKRWPIPCSSKKSNWMHSLRDSRTS